MNGTGPGHKIWDLDDTVTDADRAVGKGIQVGWLGGDPFPMLPGLRSQVNYSSNQR
jgi:hypothetical protein